MLYQVNYVIDDGYEWKKHLCVVRAKTADDAMEIAYKYAKTEQMGCYDCLLENYTVVTKLPTEGVIYSR